MKISRVNFNRNHSLKMIIPSDITEKSTGVQWKSNNSYNLKPVVVPVSDSFVYILKWKISFL